MKKKNLFEPLVGIKAKNTHVDWRAHSKNERWLFGVLPADENAPTVEDEKKVSKYYFVFGAVAILICILFGRAFYLQIVNGKQSFVLAQENRFRQQVIRYIITYCAA